MHRGNTGPLPERIGPYRIVEKIGSGGMAAVYRAVHPDGQREVAVKVLAGHLAGREELRLRFEREARALLQLHHPNILPVYDYGEDDGTPYLVMKLISAHSLDDLLQAGPLPLYEVGLLTRQIASALDYAHARGIVHRDVKPDNILLDANRTPYLADFGVAHFAGTDEVARLTLGGAFLGTAAYASPEQCRGEPVERASDIYALGVMVFEMVTGRKPFEAATPLAVMKLHMYEPPPNPCAYDTRLPQALYFVLLKALAKLPEGRYPSAMRFSEELDVALGLHPPLPDALGDDDEWLVGDVETVQPDRPTPVGTAGEVARPAGSTGPLPGGVTSEVTLAAVTLPADSFQDAVDGGDRLDPDAAAALADVAAGFSDDLDDLDDFDDDFDDTFDPDAEDLFAPDKFFLPEGEAAAPGAGAADSAPADEPSDFVVLEALLGDDPPETGAARMRPPGTPGAIRPLNGAPSAARRSHRWTGTQFAVYGSLLVSLVAIAVGVFLLYRTVFPPPLALDATYSGAALGAAFDYPGAWALSTGTLALLSAEAEPAVVVADAAVPPGGPYGGAGLVIAVQRIDPVAVFGVAGTCRERIAAGPEATFDCLVGQHFVTPEHTRFSTARYAGVQLTGTLPPTRASPPVILLGTGESRWVALAIVYWDGYDGARAVLARMARSVRPEQQPS